MRRGKDTQALGVALAIVFWLPSLLFLGLLGYADYNVESQAEFEALRSAARRSQIIAFVIELAIFAVLYGIWRLVFEVNETD